MFFVPHLGYGVVSADADFLSGKKNNSLLLLPIATYCYLMARYMLLYIYAGHGGQATTAIGQETACNGKHEMDN